MKLKQHSHWNENKSQAKRDNILLSTLAESTQFLIYLDLPKSGQYLTGSVKRILEFPIPLYSCVVFTRHRDI